MKTLLTLALLASSCFASRIADTLQDSSLVNFTGNITIKWPAYKDVNGVDQPQGKQIVYVANGVLDITLPATTDFRYEVFGRNYTGTLYSTNWIVPNTASTLTLLQVAPVIATTGTSSIYPTIGQSQDQTLAVTPATSISSTSRFYTANPTATLADAQAAAQLLADRTSYWLIQLNPIAANSMRFVLPQGSVNYAHSTINVAVQGSTGVIRPWSATLSTSPYYATTNICWGVVTALTQGCWGTGNGQLAPDHTYGVTVTANPVLLVNNPVMVDRLARAMAENYLDAEFAGLYAQFTTNSPQGLPGTNLTDVVVGQSINVIQAVSTVTKGQPVFVFLGEEFLQQYFQAAYTQGAAFSYPVTLPNMVSYFKRGLPMILNQTTLGSQATDPWELIISNQVNATGSSPKARHGLAFSSTAMGMYSMQPNANEDINNVANSGAIAAGFGIMGASTAACTANNFCSAIKYSTSATSGQNFSFTVSPAWGVGILENGHGIRIEY